MEKQKTIRTATIIGRRICIKILKGLCEKKKILSYEVLNSLSPDLYRFKIIGLNGLQFDVEIFKSYNPNSIDYIDIYFNQVTFQVGKLVAPRKFCSSIKDVIRKRMYGIQIENFFKREVEELILTSNTISKVTKSTLEEDRKGIDFFLTYMGNIVPIQIKSGILFQKKHIEKFPKIPSLALTILLRKDIKKLRLVLKDICHSYTLGIVKHL
jgi:hypothetical protein